MDTDSIVFTESTTDTFSPPTGNYLGELVDEIESKYSSKIEIEEFVSTGPKVYGMKLSNGDTILKCKGITLNNANKKTFNINLLKDVVSNTTTEVVKFPKPFNVVRNKFSATLYNKPTEKAFKMVFEKRVLKESANISYPYGYK